MYYVPVIVLDAGHRDVRQGVPSGTRGASAQSCLGGDRGVQLLEEVTES